MAYLSPAIAIKAPLHVSTASIATIMSSKTSNVILKDQSDWELWIYIVKQMAEAGDVWQHMNPD
ncbi:uncharacterized protein BDZ99DRAFT_522714 [Mytilinidion resinicola]|uniref:Uncharacterized protein n=1 Tax=Mytilinidion resinicola TaxID=574789 RepID=A0A6A6YEB4_9PEZI|nr:uncharacterized protein BDZ99DRAFT_522714 [Mytilinidion resinicola]KAF2807080.1 hypothetical protein BDZ99DRAFT_522714 [Mytilinidion resinicola]